MQNSAIILCTAVLAVMAASYTPALSQAAKCATVVECANQMVVIATDLKSTNAQLVTKNTELQTRVQALENQIRDQAHRIDAANGTETTLRTDLNQVSSKPLPREQGKCQKVDSGVNGGDLWCPAGFYMAGAENTNGRNDTLDMIWCCPSN